MDREYSREDNEQLKNRENTTEDTISADLNEGEYYEEYNGGGNTRNTTPSMGSIQQQCEKAPSTLSVGPDVKLVDKIGSKDELEKMNTRKDMNSE